LSSFESKPTLHPLERKVLTFLAGKTGWVSVDVASKESGVTPDQLRRVIAWSREEGLLDSREDTKRTYSLSRHVPSESELPERKLVRILESMGGSSDLSSFASSLGDEFNAALGKAKYNGWITVKQGKVLLASNIAKSEEELMLERLRGGPIEDSQLSPKERSVLQILLDRPIRLVEVENIKTQEIKLTAGGLKTASSLPSEETQSINAITPELLQSGGWKNSPLRPLNVTSAAPKFFPGRRHPIRMFVNEVREAFVSLGFEEIGGLNVQSALWNFDALFIPQRHPAREMQDTFYVSQLNADLERYASEIKKIKASHESGAGTGSIGWQYNWSSEEARRVVLRTHTTAVTIKYLATRRPEEAKVFSVGRVFRNEKPNYKHNPEFYQIEGVMVAPKLNIRNLIFVLTKFYAKLGFEKIKFWPTYFPYTEPSLQTMVYPEKLGKWMELGGMGVFRPEVTIPLGVKNPVLAWGLGLDRLVMLRNDLQDIRELFGAHLDWLRTARVI
jgi:phenylalanyl-tRNA synthetase alpha chain